MQNINPIDNLKLRILIEESVQCLKFLDHIKVQDDISSELAGFEISKLLKDQQNNEAKYAELVKRRSGLTGITHKRELEEVETQIANIAAILKESTKKLCKLFKQNPNLEKDSLKVSRERRGLIAKLEELMQHIQTNSINKFQGFIKTELENQDQLRRCQEKEKNLNMEIKRLQQEKNLENNEYKKEIQENLSKIQEQKERLMHKTQRAEQKITYAQKEHAAQLSNQRRMNEYTQKLLQTELANLKAKYKIEMEVHNELKDYLKRKELDIKKQSEEWANKIETTKEALERDIAKLTENKEKTLAELAEFKNKYELEEKRKMERELEEKNKAQEKLNREYQRIQLENAVKLIQNEYMAWKDAGGGKKKKKKGGKK